MRRIDMIHTGRATKNQTPHDGSGFMFWSAMRFWGEAMGDAAPPMLDDSAMPRSNAFVMSESAGRLRRMGCILLAWKTSMRRRRTYLDDGEAQYWCCDITDPHTSKHSNEHVSEEDSPRLRSSLAQNKCSHHLRNVVL